MVQQSTQNGKFSLGVTSGMIALLHKGGERKALTNWRPITLLNLSYKILPAVVVQHFAGCCSSSEREVQAKVGGMNLLDPFEHPCFKVNTSSSILSKVLEEERT